MYLNQDLYAVFAIDMCDFKHMELIRVVSCNCNCSWFQCILINLFMWVVLENGKTFCTETTKRIFISLEGYASLFIFISVVINLHNSPFAVGKQIFTT